MSPFVDRRMTIGHAADALIAPARVRTFHTLDALPGVAADVHQALRRDEILRLFG